MVEYVDSLVAQYRGRGILVDTSLLLLIYVGLHDPAQIERFNRTKEFTRKDFEYVRSFVDQFERVIVTPHIFTEVSNFLGQLSGRTKDECFALLAQHVALATTCEHSPSAESLADKEAFIRFGITDTSIVEVAAEPYLVLTTDYKLNGYLVSKGLASLNYHNFRPL